jgi:hypothetical protein
MMRNIIFTASLLISTTSLAESCPQITGLYQMAEGAVVQLQNDDCTRLIRWTGFTTKKGEIVISPEKQVFTFDGTPVCTQGKCQTAQTSSDKITFNLNYDGYVKVKEHGLCTQRQYTLSLDENGDLNTDYQVQDCDDGFSGNANKIYPRVEYPDNL